MPILSHNYYLFRAIRVPRKSYSYSKAFCSKKKDKNSAQCLRFKFNKHRMTQHFSNNYCNNMPQLMKSKILYVKKGRVFLYSEEYTYLKMCSKKVKKFVRAFWKYPHSRKRSNGFGDARFHFCSNLIKFYQIYPKYPNFPHKYGHRQQAQGSPCPPP